MTTLAYVGSPEESVEEDALGGKMPAQQEPALTGGPTLQEPAKAATRNKRLNITPRAAALAKANELDPGTIRGTGPGGRILEKDVEDNLAARAVQKQPAADSIPEVKTPQTAGQGKPLSNIRRVIAQRLTQSFTTTPHFFTTVSVDMGEIERLRIRLKTRGLQVTVTDFLIKAAGLTLLDFPVCNGKTDGRFAFHNEGIHIGMAVALEDGLLVPVVRNADQLGLLQIARLTKELSARARNGNSTLDEVTGSTFTISNLGMLNVENFTAIINPGESGILAVSSTLLQPVVVDYSIQVRPMMKMTLSSDHRLIDGVLAARFLNSLKNRLESSRFWRDMVEGDPDW